MNTVQLEVWHLIVVLMSFFGAVWAMGVVLLKQIDKRLDERFKTQEERRKEYQVLLEKRLHVVESQNRDREREHLLFVAQAERNFTRREDTIRNETALHGKMDALSAKMDLLAERQKGRASP